MTIIDVRHVDSSSPSVQGSLIIYYGDNTEPLEIIYDSNIQAEFSSLHSMSGIKSEELITPALLCP